jgi:hypothetical protein
MKSKTILILLFLLLAAIVPGTFAANSNSNGLKAGVHVTYDHQVPINLVFVGYEPADIDEGALLAQLPATYDPVVRFPQFYALPGRDLGMLFNFTYNTIYANNTFETRFFDYLQTVGEPGDLTLFQQFYNGMANNVQDVTGPILYLDGPTVEQWLESRGNAYLGIDSRDSYTIFFINWYDQPDFQYHVYTKTDEPDTDTGYNFGDIRDSRKMIAWGGSHGRTWFYDLSAGPEAWTNNYDVDNPDLNGDGFEEYRMPPIWEYTAGGYRDASALSGDLGLVTRWVGINLLFTPSPLYDPLVTAPGLFGDKVAYINMLEDDPTDSGLNWIDQTVVHNQLASFEPYYNWQVELADVNPIDMGSERSFRIFNGLLFENNCWNAYGTPFAQLFCYYDANLATYVPTYDATDYVAAVFAFNTTDANHASGLLGFADDNWVDGTQSYVFQFDTPFFRSLGYGFTSTTIHEVGHHIGLSHPHDGYDGETGIDYGASGPFYFAWSGNESDTVMHYLALSSGFGQFNQDTMYRYTFSGFMNKSNLLLADIEAHPNGSSVRRLVLQADRTAERAIRQFNNWDYLSAATNAYDAYLMLALAADELSIPPAATAAFSVAPTSMAPHEGDPIRFPDN